MTDTAGGNPETWLAARLASGQPAETWKPVAKMHGCTFSAYEASDQGRVRSLDRTTGNRQRRGVTFTTKPSKDGYVRPKLSCDNPDHESHTITMQKIILRTFDRPRPDGMEASHLGEGPAAGSWNWWPEGVAWETKPDNEARKPWRPPPPEPTHPCKNAPGCPNLVVNPGRRCMDCVAEVGRQAAAMLNDGQPLGQVAGHFGNTSRWIYELAVQHGGYEGTPEQARTQRPPLPRWKQRVVRWLGAA